MSVIEGAIGTYGETGLFDHEPSVNIMKRIMGEDWVNGEIELIKNFNQQEQPEETQPEPSSEQPTDTEQIKKNKLKKLPKRKRPIQMIKKRRYLQKKASRADYGRKERSVTCQDFSHKSKSRYSF